MNNVQWFLGDAAGNVKSVPALLQDVPSLKHFKDALTWWAASHSVKLVTEAVILGLLS